VRWAFIAALLFATAASGYEEEAKLPAGEWMILEGRSTEAVTWYRARYAENAAEWREGLAEALRARASDLLALEQPEEALPLLEEAEGLTRDPERLGRIRHLIAYAEGRTTGQSVGRGHKALAFGDVNTALASYERALSLAHDDFEREQGRTLVALALLLQATLSTNSHGAAERAATVWPEGAGLTEDVKEFMGSARVNKALRRRIEASLESLNSSSPEETMILRGTAFCVLERTREAKRALEGIQRPGWKEPLEAMLREAERLKRRK
jgi:tetratricopeptide (TPR) repeat protein